MPAPIVLFVYNRPDHTRQTVEALACNSLARESELWIFSDGPKTPAAEGRVAAVRQYVRAFAKASLFAAVNVVEAERNLGLAPSVISGVSRVMAERGCAIVLEDDLVTAPDFLAFMNACLEFYRGSQRVGSVTGYSPLSRLPRDYGESVYLAPRSCSLGWATWRDRWTRVDWEVCDFAQFWRDRAARRQFNQCGRDRADRLRRQLAGHAESWSVRFGYWQFRQGRHTVYPVTSRLRHIGWDGSGVHPGSGARLNNAILDGPSPFTLSTPEPDARLLRQMCAAYSGSCFSRLAHGFTGKGLRSVGRKAQALLRRRGVGR